MPRVLNLPIAITMLGSSIFVRKVFICGSIKHEMLLNCPPPMLFSELFETFLCEELKPVISELLEIKMNMPEIGKIPKIPSLNNYIEESLLELKATVASLDEKNSKRYDELNALFLEAMELKFSLNY